MRLFVKDLKNKSTELSKEIIEKSKKSIEINITIKALPPLHPKNT